MKRSLLYITAFTAALDASAQNTWTQKADYGASPRTAAVGFSIGTGGYIGTGYDSTSFRRNFWLYNQATNMWQQVQSLGGATGSGLSRDMATAFVIGTKAYVGTGQGSNPYLNDLWEYDAGSDVWTQKANFAGTPRRGAVSFVIGTKGYIGTGQDATGMKKDLWEYDPTANTWTAKANFPGTPRRLAVGFAIGSRGYVGTGDDGTNKGDFWQYEPSINTWTQVSNFGGTPRNGATAFVIGTKAYVGTGYDNSLTYRNDFWEFNQTTNSWTQVASFAGTARANAVGFSIGNKGYLGTGYDGSIKGDFWEFSPPVGVNEIGIQYSSSVYPNPLITSAMLSISPAPEPSEKAGLVIYTMRGEKVQEVKISGTQTIIQRDDLSAGIYIYQVRGKTRTLATGKIVITD
jgi:N-acetylneuraminic acid mutarotase